MPIITTPHNVSICYDECGEAGSPAILLIQGHGAQMLGWREEFCWSLADRGYRVIRFDNRDVGLSSKFPNRKYGFSEMAQDAAGLLHTLGVDAAHIVGQSMGGMIAQFLAIEFPEQVLSLALIYTTPSLDYVIGADLIEDRLDVPRDPTRDEAIKIYLDNEKPCASTAYDQDTEWLGDLGGQMFDRCYDPAGIERQLAAILEVAQRRDSLRSISVPTTIIHGTADRLIDPAASEALCELIGQSTLKIFPGMGHELPKPLWEEIIGQITDNTALVNGAPSRLSAKV